MDKYRWEIVERRSDGKWYTNMRTHIPDEGIMYRNWVLAHDATRYAFRSVLDDEPPLASSSSSQHQVDPYPPAHEWSKRVMMDESKARRVGQELASALITLFGANLTPDGGAQYALGRSLAAMTGEFDNADLRDAFIEGIMGAFRQVNARIAAPHREVNGDS